MKRYHIHRFILLSLFVSIYFAGHSQFYEKLKALTKGFNGLKSASDFRDKRPTYPGGELALYNYLQANMHYPRFYEKHHITAVIRVDFVIDSTGAVRNVVEDAGELSELEQEAHRLVWGMPNWNPATNKGLPANSTNMLQICFGTGTSPAKVTAKARINPLHPDPLSSFIHLPVLFEEWLNKTVGKDPLIKAGTSKLLFVVNEKDSLVYTMFTQSGGVESDSAILFALNQFLLYKRAPYNSGGWYKEFNFIASDTFKLEATFEVAHVTDETQYAAQFVAQTGTYKERKLTGNQKDIPGIDRDMDLYLSKIPDYMLPVKDTTKKIRKEYSIDIGGIAHAVSKQVIERDRHGRVIKQTDWNDKGKTVAYFNWSTGKKLTFDYSLPENVWAGPWNVRLLLDTVNIKSEKVPYEEKLNLTQVTEEALDKDGGLVSRKVIFPEGHGNSDAFTDNSYKVFYGRNGYPDSVTVPDPIHGTFNMSFTYDNNHRLLALRKSQPLEMYGEKMNDVKNYKYNYDPSGKPIQEIETMDLSGFRSQRSPPHLETDFEYDAQGRLITCTHYENADTFFTHITFPDAHTISLNYRNKKYLAADSYTFNEAGYLQQRASGSNDKGSQSIFTRKEYDYY